MRLAAAQMLRGAVQRRGFATTARRLDNYAFIGLGQMGYQMAKNLQSKLQPSDKVSLYDINGDAMKRLQAEMKADSTGAAVELAASAHDASKEAPTLTETLLSPLPQDTVITVLPEPQHVQGVYQSILAPSLPRRDRVFIDCSTIDPSTSRAVAASVAAAQQGVFADAPMSGGVGAGLSAKLANNYLLALNNIATAEAMNLGMRWGLDPKKLAGVLNVSTGRCWPSEVNNPVKGVVETAPAGRDYAGGFGIALMKKDLRLAMVAAEEAGAQMKLADAAFKVYDEAAEREDCKGRDFSVVYRYLGGKE
ncbi:3-hydroxyacid dehydrogenase/reductase [Beauveria brongniartii RCEF 3172]|uniref:3-hydroxyisobutyrate dehydrogenase n=1 Tax=Beauveria brongniartii RCEF 3172 TaxID=1081107 RepID=A0A167IFW5_9HYPO|nr:3-hydroxyacid dehydrogenase/reductase [Beauveria brongniartii RCEF 3172]